MWCTPSSSLFGAAHTQLELLPMQVAQTDNQREGFIAMDLDPKRGMVAYIHGRPLGAA